MAAVIAVDLGATSGRVILARIGDRIELEEVHRFDTAAEQRPDGLRLDVERLLAEVQDGFVRAMAAAPDGVEAVGIDSWAVDYGLLRQGRLLDDPFNYRDERCVAARERVQQLIDQGDLYSRTGIQDLPFNTINQLVDDLDSGRLAGAEQMLLLPDLLAFMLTGRAVAEVTNASTTALLDPRTRQWDWPLIDHLRLPRRIFPELVEPGTVIGTINHGPATGTPLVAVGTHDTASAVVGAPLHHPDDVYLSSGTWSLLGQELPGPVLTPEAQAANFTNEGGVDRRTRFLKNINGMWILSESIRAWGTGSVPELVERARSVSSAPVLDATDPGLIAPGDMPARVRELTGNDPRMADPAVFTRSVLESLALAYARTIDELVALTGRRPERLVIVGGGSANTLLSQLAADRTGLEVTAGPMEATALGNALIQARAVGLIEGTLEDLRRIVTNSTDIRTHRPRPAAELAAVTALSNDFGADPAFTRAGGGNSSAKRDGVLWIKPSGVSMATMTADDLVPLDVKVLVDALDAPDPDPSLGDPVNHLAQLARLDDGPRRPSVEILFHALIEDTYVLHTHPLLVNAVTCNRDGEELTRSLFGDEVLWVDYVDPGLPLAREIARRRREYTETTGQQPPKVTFLMNHGLIVSGEDPTEIRAASLRVVEVIQAAVTSRSGITEVARRFAAALSARAVAIDASSIAADFPLTPAGKAFISRGPLIPDQIVYSGSFAMVVRPEDDMAAAIRHHEETHGQSPKVAVIPGAGVAAVGNSSKQAGTALEVFLDSLTVARSASILGSVRTLDKRERTFIENWEAEAYRQKIAEK